jgi:DNA primase
MIYSVLLDREYQRELFSDLPGFQRKGTGNLACCPFHDDSLPTLLISGDRPEYFCFACSRRGDWISYLMERSGLSFHDALERLALASGLDAGTGDMSEADWKEDLLRTQVLEAAMGTYITRLWSKAGEEVLHHLYKRGYATGEVEAMSLGFYPGFSLTRQELLGQGFDRRRIEPFLAGLFQDTGESTGLVIPYRDASGRLMALVRKDIHRTGPSSYQALTDLNGVDDMPFLMHRSRNCPDVIVVEGFIDAMLLDQVRLKPVIGIGADTSSVKRLMTARRFGAEHFILALGNGERQRSATRTAIRTIMEGGLRASVLPLPSGYKDLDEFIRMTCLDHFRALLKKVVSAEKWADDLRGE